MDAWRLAAALVSAASLEDQLGLLLEAAPRIGGGDTASIYLREGFTGQLRAVARYGHQQILFGPPRPGGLTAHVLQTRDVLIVPDALAEPRVNPVVIEAGVRSFVGLPLLARRPPNVARRLGGLSEEDAVGSATAPASAPVGGAAGAPGVDDLPDAADSPTAIGVLYVNASRPDAFGPEAVEVLKGLAALAAVAIENGVLLATQREAARRLTEALDLREQFVSLASHELKAPLTPLQGYVQTITRRLDRAAASGQTLDETWLRRALSVMGVQIGRLDRLVTDLLDVSRVRTGHFTLQPATVDLVLLARTTFLSFRDMLLGMTPLTGAPGAADLTLPSDATSTGSDVLPPPKLAVPVGSHTLVFETAMATLPGQWDANRLDQLLINLLSNAVKYSPTGGMVELRLTAVTAEDMKDTTPQALAKRAPQLAPGWVHLTVRDEGIGLPVAATAAQADQAGDPSAADRSTAAGKAPSPVVTTMLTHEAPTAAVDPQHPELFRAFSRTERPEAERIGGFGLGLFICAEIVHRHGGAIWAESAGQDQGTTFHVLLPPAAPRSPETGTSPTSDASAADPLASPGVDQAV